jgi:hypothetical protein
VTVSGGSELKKAVIINYKSPRRYVNIGNNRSIPVSGIVGIYDMDNATVSAEMRKWLRDAQKSGIVISVAESLPKSIIYYDDGINENVYFSPFSTAVIQKRISGKDTE